MLSNTLVTNEVKNSAGTEVEFQRISTNNRDTVFAMISEPPDAEHRISVRHTEIGTGTEKRRRSNIQVSKVAAGASTLPRKHIASLTLDIPVGDIADFTETKNVLAELLSFCASLGASTTILYDCTGNGAATLINGTL